jgi:hypothetical protein
MKERTLTPLARDNLTPQQRSAEMKRRARVRNQNRARKSKS